MTVDLNPTSQNCYQTDQAQLFGQPQVVWSDVWNQSNIKQHHFFLRPIEAEDIRFPNEFATQFKPTKSASPFTDTIKEDFDGWAKEWKEGTAHSSFISRNVAHPAFLQILGMGKPALPMIMEALSESPRRWLLPLRLIAKANPVKQGASMDEAVAAWREWWEENRASIL